MQLGWSLPKRRELIQRLAAAPRGETFRVPFQGRLPALVISRVPVEFPKYRLDNGRTQAAQAEYLATHPELPRDFFALDFESEAAQRAQHEILKTMISGGGDKDLERYFSIHEQEEPLILSEDGYVVNGNRRLCAFRELISEDLGGYNKLKNIEVVFLPPADQRDLDRLEARLQITQDIKADYSWTAKAFMLRTRRDEQHSFDEDELSSLYELPVSGIKELIDMLSLAEVYLADRQTPKQYARVENSEFAFRQLAKHRRTFKTEAEKEIFERIAYCLIDQPRATGGRIYAAIPEVKEHFDKVLEAIQETFPSPEPPVVSSPDLLLGTQTSPLTGVATILSDPENFGIVRDLVTEVIASENELKSEQKKDLAAISLIRKALNNLQGALASIRSGASRNGLAGDLTRVSELAEEIRRELDDDTVN